MYQQERDIDLKGRGGLNIVFERFYNSHVRKDGPLGYGWTHSFNHYLKFFTDDNGSVDRVIWVDGTASTFSVEGTTYGVHVGTILTNPEGIYVRAQRLSNGNYRIREKNGLTLIFEGVSGTLKPSTLKNAYGNKLGTTARLLSIIDRNGNTLRMNYAGDKLASVQDDFNRRLTFHYDNGDQHITRITDWGGRTFRYTYANNNLVRVDSPLAVEGRIGSTTYAYYTAADGTNLDHAMQSFARPAIRWNSSTTPTARPSATPTAWGRVSPSATTPSAARPPPWTSVASARPICSTNGVNSCSISRAMARAPVTNTPTAPIH